jgi:hypothetical protein
VRHQGRTHSHQVDGAGEVTSRGEVLGELDTRSRISQREALIAGAMAGAGAILTFVSDAFG